MATRSWRHGGEKTSRGDGGVSAAPSPLLDIDTRSSFDNVTTFDSSNQSLPLLTEHKFSFVPHPSSSRSTGPRSPSAVAPVASLTSLADILT
eukprot:scaffold53066_cov33-Tisochrysis_lutea.AAC.1